MKTISSLLASVAVIAVTAGTMTACDQNGANSLTVQPNTDYWSTPAAATHNPAPSHMAQAVGSGQNGITDPKTAAVQAAQLGTPDQVARMHGTQKIQYAMLGSFLTDLGVTMTASTGGGSGVATAGDLYVQGSSALGAPLYGSRTPEMIIPSTAALAKEYDVFMAAAAEIMTGAASSTRCPSVVLISNGELTQDGISCLIGKPATADHVSLAQAIVAGASDATTGQQIAIATLLAAAHISE
jgi:hypothetical protein